MSKDINKNNISGSANNDVPKLKIALGDLRHKTTGKHSVFMPIGIGYIAAYTISRLGESAVEIRLYDDAEPLLNDIKNWQPDIVGLSNYSWNTELSRLVFKQAKKIIPNVVCIAGGPELPCSHQEIKEYLSARLEIDFYVVFEGECPFADLTDLIRQDKSNVDLKSRIHPGVASISPETGDLVFGDPLPRMENLDQIPSPYTTGLMDQWFDGTYSPAVETARGCPFTCGYCFAGQQKYSRVNNFSFERIIDELTYMAEKMKQYPNIPLLICDSNFGMYERDEEIAAHLMNLQKKFNWPNSYDITIGKSIDAYNRILRISAMLENKMHITTSLQSLNPETLSIIKRHNIGVEDFRQLNLEMKERGINTVTELIVPLPRETKESFFKGFETVINIIGSDRIVPYTTIMLKGTDLSSKESREKYKLQTKYRILPRQYSEYLGEKCFEVEEVCVATDTISFEDYLEIRGFVFLLSFFSGEQFDVIHRHLKEYNISVYDYLYFLWELIKSGGTELSSVYNRFLEETKAELYDSPEAIYEYFNRQENYDKLLSGEYGDNLIRKYSSEILLDYCIPAIELAYVALKKVVGQGLTKEAEDSFLAAKDWLIALRDISSTFKDEFYLGKQDILNLLYDVNAWYQSSNKSKSLINYNQSVSYQISHDLQNIKNALSEGKTLWGGDLNFQIGRLLSIWSVKYFWRQCKKNEDVLRQNKSTHYIDGDRIYLRELKVEDASSNYCSWLNDPEVNKYLETKTSTIDKLKKYIQKQIDDPNSIMLGIFTHDNVHIGNIKLEPIDWQKGYTKLGILIGNKKYWNQGIGTEATKLVVAYALDKLNLNEIELGVICGNNAAIRVYEKVGFKTVEVRKVAYKHSGVLRDAVIMTFKKDSQKSNHQHSTGFEIVKLTLEKYSDWDNFCVSSDDAWFWHTSSWLDYTLNFKPELKSQSYSFMVVANGQIMAICPLILEENKGVLEFSFGQLPIPVPAFSNNLSQKTKYKVMKLVYSQIDDLAKEAGVKRASFRFSVLNKSFIESADCQYNYLSNFGYLDTSIGTQIIDLSLSIEAIRGAIRHGHNSDINRAEKILTADIFDSGNITAEIFEDYAKMHISASPNRINRSHILFEIMYNSIKNKNAVLISAQKDDQYIGFSYFYLYKDNAYYGSSCNRGDIGNVGVAHFIQWQAIKWLKDHKFKFYELGWQNYCNSLSYFPSQKELNIAGFKRGFGGSTVPLFRGEKYYDQDYFLNIYNDRIKRYGSGLCLL